MPAAQSSLVLGAILAVFLVTRPVWAAGDPKQGHALAQTWCSSCHTVDANGPGKDTAPSFASIARQEKPQQREARAFLYAPHPPMPDFNLSRSEIDDVVAYLNSLAEP